MFRKIRKKNNEISEAEVKKLLHSCRRGVLSVNGDRGYPYGIPVNYIYDEENSEIIFHGAKAGHKADSIRENDKVCFTVTGDEIIREEPWAPFVQSAVIFGRCRMVTDRSESDVLLKKFAMKYYPDEAMADEEISLSGKGVQMYVIGIEHMSGKEVQEK